jgi:hypothetical protein
MTCFRGAVYFKLVFGVNRKIIKKLSALTILQKMEEGGNVKETFRVSRDSSQNSLNEDPVPVTFTNRVSSTHVTPRAGRVEGLESRENILDLSPLSDAHK